MTTQTSVDTATLSRTNLANALAERLEEGARRLAAFALSLTDNEWRTPMPHDGRALGVIVHHVASVYPVEIQLAQTIAAGTPVTGVTMADIDAMNATHAAEHATATRADALDLLRANSATAAAAIRALSEEQLTQAVAVSLYGDAPLTCQFFLEDHAVRHSYHHLSRMRRVVQR